MTDEKWNTFFSSGKVVDYLDYKGILINKQWENGDKYGNGDLKGNRYTGISGR